MPELPDIEIYRERLSALLLGCPLAAVRIVSPFVVRTVEPRLSETVGRRTLGFTRLGKRLVWHLEDELFIVVHLMLAGRFHWRAPGAKPPGKIGLAAFDFEHGTLLLTEASTKKRASLHVVRGEDALGPFQRSGIEVLETDLAGFTAALTRESHTLKRALTDPDLFSGIGNAYSDEILHRAQLSPLALSQKLSSEQVSRLYDATRETLRAWTERLRREVGDGFPEKVTAFRPGMAVHGRFRASCPVCGTSVQRIVYAENECNYCPRCQTEGKLLADRSLSRLLKDDWPKTIDELEGRRGGGGRA